MRRPPDPRKTSGSARPSPATTGREVAGVVLARVLGDGAWASRALDAELDRAGLSPSEAARATDLVYGALRSRADLDVRIEAACTKDLPEEVVALSALRAAAYELFHTRAESHAVVDGWVAFVKRERGEGLARFVNAVLRKLAAARPPEPLQLTASFPRWVHAVTESALGKERASAFFSALAGPPHLCLRARAEAEREALFDTIRNAHPAADVRLGTLSPLAVLSRGVGDPRRLPGYREGRFAVQDEGSQLIVRALGAQPGERVVDACSGRGGKTLALADRVGQSGRMVAIDLAEAKLEQLALEMKRLGIEDARVERHAVDLTVGLGGLPEASFDRVLIDAPCTGLGTLGRRPEIGLRMRAEDPGRMAVLQRAIVDRALRLVKPGGRLVFAVCSVASIEVRAVRDRPELEMEPLELGVPVDPDGVFRVGPWNVGHSMDAYQVAVFRRRAT